MSLKRNIIANYLGQGWTTIIGIIFIPIYINYLGMEAYGLIGAFAMLLAWLTLLDLGMTPTMNREMARFSSGAHTARSIRELLFSIEVICYSVAILIGVAIWGTSDWVAENWLRADKIPVEDVALALTVMGAVLSLRLVEGLYRGAILGLQQQVWFNSINALLATIRALGAIAVLAWISPTIAYFFLWQGLVSLFSLGIMALHLHRKLPQSTDTIRFSKAAIKGIWKFARSMFITTFLTLLLTQVDKVLLSSLLTLEAFGYYTLATTVASGLSQLVGPIAQACYPKFTQLISNHDQPALVRTYHQAAKLMTVMLVPGALVLIFFSEELLLIWTGNRDLAINISTLVSLLAIGTTMNGLMHVPYMLQLASGWSSLAMWINAVAVVVFIPAILLITPRFGAAGVALVWVVLNASYLLFGIQLMHRRLMPSEKRYWYIYDTGIPTAASLFVAILFWLFHPGQLSRPVESAWLLIAGLAISFAAVISIKEFRERLAQSVSRTMIRPSRST